MLTREVAERIYENYFGFEPNQEDLELWLYGQAEVLDNRMLTATGPELDRLQTAKNEIAGLLDDIAFSYTLDRADDAADLEAYQALWSEAA